VTAILDSSNEMQFNPSSNMVINSGDVLICIGDRENLESLDEIAKGRKSAYEEA
jgi:K+/H+ antiporter YhaU regulatory subunit KhtT